MRNVQQEYTGAQKPNPLRLCPKDNDVNHQTNFFTGEKNKVGALFITLSAFDKIATKEASKQ